MKDWIQAFRLRTLPLAVSSIAMGSFLAASHGGFDILVASLCVSTAIALQILSNLANDYGDFKKGTDKHRKDRQLAGGKITPKAMIIAMVIFTSADGTTLR